MALSGIGGGSANYTVQQQAQKRARGADAAGMQKPVAAEYDQTAYLKDLNSRLNASVIPGAWNGKDAFGADKATAMIHPDFLRTMHDNPEIGAEYEAKINEWAKIDANTRERMAAQGHTITSLGMSVDKDGKESYHMAGYNNGGPGGSGGKPEMTKVTKDKDDKKTPKELMEEMLKRIEEKRQEEKLEADRAADAEAAAKLTESDAGYFVDTMA
jgi:hypothetical protein